MKLLQVYFMTLAIMSLVTFVMFAVDKRLSHNEHKRRIPESALLSFCAFGGSLGALTGMYLLRHKTDFSTKFHFALTAWISLALQFSVPIAGAVLLMGGSVNI